MPADSSAALAVNPEWEVHPADVKHQLDQKQDLLILDVRRQSEFDKTRIPGALLIPLDQLESRAVELADYLDRPIVVHCHHGVRSMNGTAILRKKGFTNVHSMAGGIDAWSVLVDPSVARY